MSAADKLDRIAHHRFTPWAVVLFAVLLYLPSVSNKFAMDDEPIASSKCVTYPDYPGDPVITGLLDDSAFAYFTKFFQKHYWWPESHNDGLYRPVSVLSYGLVYQAFGRFSTNEAMPQHLFNVLLNGWAVWLVIALLLAVGASRVVALAAGLLFGLHAVHSEVVAGIIGRAEIFSFCFGAQAVLWMWKGCWWRYTLAGLFFFCAFGSKEVALTWIPFYVCLVLVRGWEAAPDAPLWKPLRVHQWGPAAMTLFVPLALWLILRHFAVSSEPMLDAAADFSSNPLAHTSAFERILTGIKVWGYGLWLCVVPHQLSCLYSPHVFSIVSSPVDPGFLAAFVALAALLFAGLRYGRRQPLFFLAMASFLGFGFVTSNVPLAIGTIFGERLYYTPSLGICVLLAWLFAKYRGPVAIGLLVLWCGFNVVQASIRTADWRDSSTLFFTDVEKFPTAIDLHRKAASMHLSAGETDKAIEHYEESIRLHANYAHGFRGLGKCFRAKKQWQKAIDAYQKSYGQGYADPPGAESIAFKAIGDCYLAMAAEAKEEPAKRKLIGDAMRWYGKAHAVPAFGDSHGEAHNKIGFALIQLSDLETDMKKKIGARRQAIDAFLRTLALEQEQNYSRRKAFSGIFSYAFEPQKLLPPQAIGQLYEQATKVVGEDPELTLLMGAAAYKAGMPPQYVYTPLHIAVTSTPEAKRDVNFYKSQVFYADALAELGDVASARRVLEMLLGRPELDLGLKTQIQNNLRSDPKLQLR